ncbi:hypothetical protein V5O48_016965 [Marasmius crinis-equi]|uniref:DUF6532 domain-containing protein n=1 Tax=Marasmius crinis-equi TaxID=585013 RepID=A0ABR3EQB6_9AGAR
MRQKGDDVLIDILQRLRTGTCTEEDKALLDTFVLSNKDCSAETKSLTDITRWVSDPANACPLITYTNSARDAHNFESAKAFAAATGQDFHVYCSVDVRGARNKKCELQGLAAEVAWQVPVKKAQDLAGRLPLIPGMPVFGAENLAPELGISKGSQDFNLEDEAIQEIQNDPAAGDDDERADRNATAEEANIRQLFPSTQCHDQLGSTPSSRNTMGDPTDFLFPSPIQSPNSAQFRDTNTGMASSGASLNPQVMLDPLLDDDSSDDDDDDDDEISDDSGEQVLPRSRRKRGFNGLSMSTLELQIANLATRLFSARLIAVNPFPEHIQIPGAVENPRESLAVQSWNEATVLIFRRHGILDVTSMAPSIEQVKLIKNRDVWIRGRFKTAARSGAVSQFGFKIRIEEDVEIQDMKTHNEDLLAALKADDAFIFQDFRDIDKPGTVYRNPLIKDVILEALYNNDSKSVGAAVQHIFGDLMPLPVIALATTAIECALDEYDEGLRRPQSFKTDKYHTIYSHHIKQLNSWNVADRVKGTATLQEYQKYLIALARKSTGAKPPAQLTLAREDIPASRFC